MPVGVRAARVLCSRVGELVARKAGLERHVDTQCQRGARRDGRRPRARYRALAIGHGPRTASWRNWTQKRSARPAVRDEEQLVRRAHVAQVTSGIAVQSGVDEDLRVADIRPTGVVGESRGEDSGSAGAGGRSEVAD